MRQIEAVTAQLAILSILELERIDILAGRSSHEDIGIRSILFDCTFGEFGIDTENSSRTHQLHVIHRQKLVCEKRKKIRLKLRYHVA